MPETNPDVRILLQIGGTVAARQRSGVHRVSLGLARALPRLAPTDFVLWDPREKRLRYAGISELDALFGPGDWPKGVDVRPEAWRVNRQVDFRRGAAEVWLVDPELAYHSPGGVEGLEQRLLYTRQLGVRTAAIGHDLIPIRRPDYAGDRAAHAAYVAALANADLLLAVSKYAAKDFSAYWREVPLRPVTIRACPLPDGGFDPAFRSKPCAAGPVELLMVGSVEPRKRQLQAIRAFGRARSSSRAMADARLRIIGGLSGAVAKDFRRLVARTPGVSYAGYASEADLEAAYDAATATLFMSDEEGFGLPIAESLVRGVPCLCADFGAMSEVAAGGGCLQVDVRDEDSVQSAIVTLCEDKDLRRRLRSEIESRTFRTWDDYASAVIGEIRSAPKSVKGEIGSPPGPSAPHVPPASIAPPNVFPGRSALRGPHLLRLSTRLGASVIRHGPAEVLRFGLDMMTRQGLRGAIRYALGRARPPAVDEALRLDAEFGLASQAWRSWVKGRLEALPAHSASPALRLAVHIEGGDEIALSRTRASLEALALHERRSGGAMEVGEGEVDASATRPVLHLYTQAGDELEPGLGALLARAADQGGYEVLTFDLVQERGGAAHPLFLPGANATLALASPSLYSRFAIADGARPKSWRTLSAPDLICAWIEATPLHERRGRWRHVGDIPAIKVAGPPAPRVQQSPARPLLGRVSVVICTKDKGHLLRQLVRSLLQTRGVEDIVVVSNGSSFPHAKQTLRDISQYQSVSVLTCDDPFNFSSLANMGAKQAQGEYLLFLNDDITPVSQDWLATLLACFEHPHTGAAGPLLVYPNERVQHAGMHLGFHGIAGHTLRHAALPRDDYLGLASVRREAMAVTGAVLLTPRIVFEALGGFDERLASYLQDVDYCLRAREGGRVTIFEPASVLIHMESVSVLETSDSVLARQRTPERDLFRARWGRLLDTDPLFPAGLDANDESLRTLRSV